MTWHLAPDVLSRYAGGTVTDVDAHSVEAHLLACGPCRSAVGELVPRPRLEAIWTDIVIGLDAPRPTLVERLLRRIGVAEDQARLLAATPALSLSWLLAVSTALAFGVLASHLDDGRGFVVFLVVAPVLPVLGVAVSYGPGLDPTFDIGVAAPRRGWQLLLLRSLAVLASTVLLAAVAALVLPVGAAAAAWLLPGLGLTLATLALSTAVRPAVAATTVVASWVAIVVLPLLMGGSPQLVAGPAGQLGSAALAIVAAGILSRRLDTFELGR